MSSNEPLRWLSRLVQPSLQRRLDALAAVAARVQQGDRSLRVADSGRDELGRFVAAFNSMLGSLEARERELVEVRDEFAAARERVLVTLSSIGDAVITTDERGVVTFVNPTAQKLTGWSEGDALGRPLPEVFDVADDRTRETLGPACLALIAADRAAPLIFESTLYTRDRRRVAVKCTAAPIARPGAGVIGLVIVFDDVTEVRALNERVVWQASHDPLTGLCNRFAAEQAIAAAVRAARDGGEVSTLLYLDLDQFKVVNDTSGHAAGDELLRELAQVLLGVVRGGDLLARMGGDEFAVLMRGVGVEVAASEATYLWQGVRDFRYACGEQTHSVGVSIGVVVIGPDTDGLGEVMRKAEMACLAAKEAGRNRIHLYEDDDTLLARQHGDMQWVSRILAALGDGRFLLLFQPIAPTVPGNGRGLHFEVLIRMLDEEGQFVSPGHFIPAAERYGLMQSIDRWVVRRVLRWFRQSRRRVDAVEACAINLSGQSLGDDSFVQYVVDELEASGVPGSRLCFEVTETAAIANIGIAQAFMTTLKARGCRFSLDDFGSGMSSFGYLKQLPVDYLKIDGSFVRNLLEDPVSRAIIAAVSSIGRVMQIETVAEFVENEALLSEVRTAGITYAQGYHIGRPTPLDGLLPPDEDANAT